jgi:DNA polymerase-3 subunit delta'
VLAKAGTHPDIQVLATEKVQITIAEVRDLVSASVMGSSVGRFRIMVIEDADRMSQSASNVLLKALEEPPTGTLWILCAPSEVDMLPTIRSRVRRVGLKVPSVEDVAQLLITRNGIEPGLARSAAAEAQSHIGMALRLATVPKPGLGAKRFCNLRFRSPRSRLPSKPVTAGSNWPKKMPNR